MLVGVGVRCASTSVVGWSVTAGVPFFFFRLLAVITLSVHGTPYTKHDSFPVRRGALGFPTLQNVDDNSPQ